MAEECNVKIVVSPARLRAITLLELPCDVRSVFTTNHLASPVLALSMMDMSYRTMAANLEAVVTARASVNCRDYFQLMCFCPTGENWYLGDFFNAFCLLGVLLLDQVLGFGLLVFRSGIDECEHVCSCQSESHIIRVSVGSFAN